MPEEKIAISEERQPRRHDIPTGGIFLVFIGTVLLLQSLDILPWALWSTLWRFWPVLLITAGLSILLRGYNVWLVSALVMAILFASLGLAVWQHENQLPPGQSAESLSVTRLSWNHNDNRGIRQWQSK